MHPFPSKIQKKAKKNKTLSLGLGFQSIKPEAITTKKKKKKKKKNKKKQKKKKKKKKKQ